MCSPFLDFFQAEVFYSCYGGLKSGQHTPHGDRLVYCQLFLVVMFLLTKFSA